MTILMIALMVLAYFTGLAIFAAIVDHIAKKKRWGAFSHPSLGYNDAYKWWALVWPFFLPASIVYGIYLFYARAIYRPLRKALD